MSRKVTLQDVADYCGLSKSMVAYVIREPETCKATEHTKERVARAVKELNYVPNYTARALSTSQSYTVGILFPALNNFFRALELAISSELARRNYFGMSLYWQLDPANSQEQFRASMELLKRYCVDGVITCHHDPMQASPGFPVVFYGNETDSMDCVFPDKGAYGHAVVEYLYKKGHRKIGFMGVLTDRRTNAIRECMKEKNLELVPSWFIHSLGLMEQGYHGMKRILQCREIPTALIVHSDEMAMGAIRAAYEAGIRIPDDLSMVSYDNLSESSYMVPALTTFDQHYELGAKYLVELLIGRIRNPQMPFQKRSFELTLMERDSVRDLNLSK